MKTKFWAGLLLTASLVSPGFGWAQDAPIPMPRRPDRVPSANAQSTILPDATLEAPDAELASPAETATTAVEAVEAIIADPQPVTLIAKITDEGSNIPDGLVWRIFETRTDASGELALAAKSEEATARIALTPGDYVVHVAYGRAQTTDTITVLEGDNAKSIILDAGAMRLNAAVTGDVPIAINLLRFDIFTPGEEGQRTLVANNLGANDIVTLNAGTYHVVSYFGDVNAVVRADLRVEPGQLTDATLYHHAAQVSLKLVSEPGGEAIADIDWTVKTADGQTVFSNIGAFPSAVLGEGDYLVLAKRGETVYNREFQVQPGATREIEVLTTVY